jgi:hypothetical protein
VQQVRYRKDGDLEAAAQCLQSVARRLDPAAWAWEAPAHYLGGGGASTWEAVTILESSMAAVMLGHGGKQRHSALRRRWPGRFGSSWERRKCWGNKGVPRQAGCAKKNIAVEGR